MSSGQIGSGETPSFHPPIPPSLPPSPHPSTHLGGPSAQLGLAASRPRRLLLLRRLLLRAPRAGREELVRQLHAGRDALAASLLLQRRARPPTTSLGQLPEADPGALQGQDRVRAHAHGHRPVRVYGVHVEQGGGLSLTFPGHLITLLACVRVSALHMPPGERAAGATTRAPVDISHPPISRRTYLPRPRTARIHKKFLNRAIFAASTRN